VLLLVSFAVTLAMLLLFVCDGAGATKQSKAAQVHPTHSLVHTITHTHTYTPNPRPHPTPVRGVPNDECTQMAEVAREKEVPMPATVHFDLKINVRTDELCACVSVCVSASKCLYVYAYLLVCLE